MSLLFSATGIWCLYESLLLAAHFAGGAGEG